MKKVLIAANQFPPMGGAGVQRTSKFVKYLRNYGYEPIVLTREFSGNGLKDETLLRDIPENTEIIRTKPYDTYNLSGIARIPGKVISKYILIPDGDRIWAERAKKKALDIVKKENIKVIYTTSAPYSGHLIGQYVKKNIKDIKWVADFRDEWTNNPYTLDNPHNPIRAYIEKKMERKVLLTADILVTNTPVMRRNFIENGGLRGDNFFVIPNGYDGEDFALYKGRTKQENEKFNLTYTGAFYGRRKPDTFFRALSELIEENKIDGRRIEVKLIGNYHIKEMQKKIDGYSLNRQVEIVGYLPHDECVKMQLSADVLVLIEGTGVGDTAFYTGKLFEYMNTGKPVLSVIPEKGAAASLVRETNIGLVAHYDDVEQIKKNLLIYYNGFINKTIEYSPDLEEIKKYERKELTKRLAALFG